MIVCSCTVTTRKAVEEVARRLSLEAGRPVTAGRIFRALGVRPQCGTCLPFIRRIAAEAGAMVTCPEPLAMVADERVTLTEVEVEIVFDVGRRLA